jgi:hypothetical protein
MLAAHRRFAMADDPKIRSFEEFWPYYVGEHRLPVCRGLHYFGTTVALLAMFAAVVTAKPYLVPLALVLGYGPAWVGHFFEERNRPATFKYPIWSLMADFKMLAFALQGRMASEVTRLYGSAAPPSDAPLLVER